MQTAVSRGWGGGGLVRNRVHRGRNGAERQNCGMEFSANAPGRARIVAAVLTDDDQVLLCHRTPERTSFPAVWDLPGGHIEPGESPRQALVRELREELGITIGEPSSPPVALVEGEGFEMLVWVIDSWSGTVTNTAPEEHDDLAWLDLEAVGRLLLAHGDYAGLLARLITRSS
jgi:8-oxo-dGTP diphosphatase